MEITPQDLHLVQLRRMEMEHQENSLSLIGLIIFQWLMELVLIQPSREVLLPYIPSISIQLLMETKLKMVIVVHNPLEEFVEEMDLLESPVETLFQLVKKVSE